MTEERKEFNKFRKDLKKEHGWPGIICARCGHFVKGGRFGAKGHLHHLVPLRNGGANATQNLVPLCHCCHDDIEELIQLGVTAEEFLQIPTTVDLLIANRQRGVVPDMPYEDLLKLTRKIGREMESVKYEEKRESEGHEGDWPDYQELWEEEKKVFPLITGMD